MDIKTYENKLLREKLHFKEMDSGLKIYFLPKEGYRKQYGIFSTDYGSIDNSFLPLGEEEILQLPQGIAHFLEHKLFEDPENNLFDKFSLLGADVNAYTNFTRTSYLFEGTDNFYESLELLIKFVQEPYFTDENVEKEKGIIEQEINMYKDDPGWRVYFNCLKAMYKEHPVKIDIAGTVESIQDINKDLLYKCYKTFYNPSNMLVFLVGDLSFDEIIRVVEKAEKKDYPRMEEIQRIFPQESDQIASPYIEESMLTSAPIFNIGFKDNDNDLSGRQEVKKDILTNLILDMLFSTSSIFFNKLYEEGLIDDSFGAYYTGKKNYGHSLIIGESEEPSKVYQRIMDYLNKPMESILLEDDFNRIKKRYMGEFLMGLNSIEFIANNFINLYHDDFLIIDYLDLLNEIEFQDIEERFKYHFQEKNAVLSIIKPLE